nr:putative G protein [IRE/CTVM19-associated rhabdovirus]
MRTLWLLSLISSGLCQLMGGLDGISRSITALELGPDSAEDNELSTSLLAPKVSSPDNSINPITGEVHAPGIKGTLYSDDHGHWLPVFPRPPLPCAPEQLDDSTPFPVVVTIWGPSTRDHTRQVTLYQRWFTRSACTVYFWGSKWERVLEDTIAPMDINSRPETQFPSNQREIWTDGTRPEVSCRWTGEVISEGFYYKQLKTKAHLGPTGGLTFPHGFPHCRSDNHAPCMSEDKTTLIIFENPAPPPKLCSSLEAKLVAHGTRSLGPSKDLIQLPAHHLEFSLVHVTSFFRCNSSNANELILLPSGYIISVHANLSHASLFLRNKMDSFWSNLNETHDPHTALSESGWLIVHGIPLRPDYSEAEMLRGLELLSDQSKQIFSTMRYLNCRRHEEAWALATAISPLNPTPLAQLASRSPQVLGAIHQGVLFAILPQPVLNISLTLPLQGSGSWAKIQFVLPSGEGGEGWMESFTGRIRPVRPAAHEDTSLTNFWVPLHDGRFWNPMSHLHLLNVSSADETSPWKSLDLSSISLGAIYSPSHLLPTPAYVGAAASVHFILAHMTGHGVWRTQGADASASVGELSGFLSSAFGWWDVIKWTLVAIVVIILLALGAVIVSKIIRHVSLSRPSPPTSPGLSLDQLKELMRQ